MCSGGMHLVCSNMHLALWSVSPSPGAMDKLRQIYPILGEKACHFVCLVHGNLMTANWIWHSLVAYAMHLVPRSIKNLGLWCVSPSPGGALVLVLWTSRASRRFCHQLIAPDHGAISLYIKHFHKKHQV